MRLLNDVIRIWAAAGVGFACEYLHGASQHALAVTLYLGFLGLILISVYREEQAG